MARVKNNFVDNARLKAEFVAYRQTEEWKEYARQKAAGNKKFRPPPLPKFVGEAIWLIANNFALKPNWRNLRPIMDDMIGDAVLACLKYAHNYDPESGTSAFGYITEGVKTGFLQTIQKDKHQKVSVVRAIVSGAAVGQFESYSGQMPGRHTTTHAELLMKHYDDTASLDRDTKTTHTFSSKRGRKKRVASKPANLDFLDE